MNAKRKTYDHGAQRQMEEYLRNSHYDEYMALVREGWLESRQLAQTSRQFLNPTPSPSVRTEGGENE